MSWPSTRQKLRSTITRSKRAKARTIHTSPAARIHVQSLQHPDFLGKDFEKLTREPGVEGYIDPDQKFDDVRQQRLFKKAYMWAQKYRTRNKDEDKLRIKDIITDEDKKRMGLKKQIPLRRIMTREFNWNPYKDSENKNVSNAALIPKKNKVGGWGLQPTPRYGTVSFWGTWPDQDLIAEGIKDGRRLDDSYLLNNPLNRDYIDLMPEFERTSDPQMATDENGEEHPVLDYTNEVDPASFDEDAHAFHNMRQVLEKRARKDNELRRTLPPFKRGFEDVPVKVRERDYHLPEHTGEIRQKWRARVNMTIYLKHLEPKLSEEEIIAVSLICNNSRYNPDTTELQLVCDDCWTREENEERCLDWFALILDEAKRLAKAESSGVKTWEDYQELFGEEMKQGPDMHEAQKAVWREEMLALPEHTRRTYNLYLAGPRMRKIAQYADASYEKMTDAGDILQIEGPLRSDSMGLWRGKLPKGAEMIENVDDYPDNPSDFEDWQRARSYDLKDYHKLSTKQRETMVLNKRSELETADMSSKDTLPKHPYFPYNKDEPSENSEIDKLFNWPTPPADPKELEQWMNKQDSLARIRHEKIIESRPVFGLRSCFYTSKGKAISGNELWSQPFSMPLIGERLTRAGLNPTTSPEMYKLYKTGKVKRVVNRMFWGPADVVTKKKKEDTRDEELSKKKKGKKGQGGEKTKPEDGSLFFKAISDDIKAGYVNPAAYKEKSAS